MTKFAKIRRDNREVVEILDSKTQLAEDEQDEFDIVSVEDGTKVGDVRPGSTEGQQGARGGQQGQQGQQSGQAGQQNTQGGQSGQRPGQGGQSQR